MFSSRWSVDFLRCRVYDDCRFFSGVSLPPNFPGDPHLKIPSKLRETFKGSQSYFEQRLRSEQDIVSHCFNSCLHNAFVNLGFYDENEDSVS